MIQKYKAYIIAVLLAGVVIAVIFVSGVLDREDTQQNQSTTEQETIRILEAKKERMLELLDLDSRIFVYFKGDAEENYILNIQQALEQKQDTVKSVLYRTSEQATQEFREENKDNVEIIQQLEAFLAQGVQVLPPSLIIDTHRDNFRTLTTELEETLDIDSQIENIDYRSHEDLIADIKNMDFKTIDAQTLEAVDLLLKIQDIESTGNVDEQIIAQVRLLIYIEDEYQQVLQVGGQPKPSTPRTQPAPTNPEPEPQSTTQPSTPQPEPTQNQERPDEPVSAPTEQSTQNQQFSSCAEAKKAGYKNLTKQQVDQFGIKTRDGDGDGVYCE